MNKKEIPTKKEISELLDLVLHPVKHGSEDNINVDNLIDRKIKEIGGKEGF